MCGIVGYIGQEKCLPKIINGLESLEYRGYDSAGVAYIEKEKIILKKKAGRLTNLIKELDFNTSTYGGIGHTRWATHGVPNEINAHPHQVGKFTIVHNGIIENYSEIKKELMKKNYVFKSETDTEVACALLDSIYQKEKNILKTINKANQKMRGSFALGIICVDDPETIYATRVTSPLIVASSSLGSFIASDVPAILNETNKYYLLDDYEISALKKDKIIFYNQDLKEIKKKINIFDGNMEASKKDGYKHFMLKEIHEEATVFTKTIESYFDGSFKPLEKVIPNLKKFTKIDIVACGSAYHAGLIGKYLLEEYANIAVNVEVASEYRYKKCFYDDKTLVILVSQSGETADTLAALRKAKNDGITTLAIVNVMGSNIAREADYVIYTKAGCEIAVATTKAYLAQVAIFSLLAIYLAQYDLEKITKEIKKIPSLITKLTNNTLYFDIADKIYKNEKVFFIGRGIDYALSMEGSLKLKEISYINSSAYQAGELKHGTISLIEKNTPVIAISTNEELREKTISNIKEVKSRGAYVIYLTNEEPKDQFYDDLILIPAVSPLFSSILAIIPLQLLAYKIADNKGCDIDKPRNLAKSVTVE